MKTVKIGDIEYQRIETLFDIYDERWVVFKQYLLQVFENIDKPLFEITYQKCKGFYNQSLHSDVIIELTNFKKAIELKDLNYDAYSICFALLHLEKDESQKNNSSDFHLQKLGKMRENGLNRGEIVEVVENFIKASGTQLAAYSMMLEMMKKPEQ